MAASSHQEAASAAAPGLFRVPGGVKECCGMPMEYADVCAGLLRVWRCVHRRHLAFENVASEVVIDEDSLVWRQQPEA